MYTPTTWFKAALMSSICRYRTDKNKITSSIVKYRNAWCHAVHSILRTLKHWELSPAQNAEWLEAREVRNFEDNSEASLPFIKTNLWVTVNSKASPFVHILEVWRCANGERANGKLNYLWENYIWVVTPNTPSKKNNN